MQLADKVAVITGAARGLGRAYAEALAAEGAAIVAADLNDCGETVGAVESAGGRALSTTVDVSDAASCEAMASLAMDAFGRVDVLINNAALYAGLKGARFEHLDEAQWDRVMQVNIKGTWLTSRAVVDHMRESGGGARRTSQSRFTTALSPEMSVELSSMESTAPSVTLPRVGSTACIAPPSAVA